MEACFKSEKKNNWQTTGVRRSNGRATTMEQLVVNNTVSNRYIKFIKTLIILNGINIIHYAETLTAPCVHMLPCRIMSRTASRWGLRVHINPVKTLLAEDAKCHHESG